MQALLPEWLRVNVDISRTKRQVSTQGGAEPLWAHSGNELFYRTPANQLVAAQVEAEESFRVVEHLPLFTWSTIIPVNVNRALYDVAPDDQRFLGYGFVAADGSVEVIVVENFLEELKAKVGGNR